MPLGRSALRLAGLTFLCVAAVSSTGAQAGNYSVQLPDVRGLFSFSPSQQEIAAGTFAFDVPANEVILQATVSGYFGQAVGITTSAPAQVFADGVLVATCGAGALCTSAFEPTAWSYTLNSAELGLLSDGKLALGYVQTACCAVQFSGLTLNFATQVSAIPEPHTVALLLSGLVPVVIASRRSRFRFSV
jgi:hypothetical protein